MDIHNQYFLFSVHRTQPAGCGVGIYRFQTNSAARKIGGLRSGESDEPGVKFVCPDRFAKQPREIPVAAFAKFD
jgi:hypothetical protein